MSEPSFAPGIRAPDSWLGPVPADEPESRPYWRALRRHELSVQRCGSCRRWHHPPVLRCPACGSVDVVFEPVSGHGKIYALTACYREFGLRIGTPWVAAYVELAEGVRIATNIVDCEIDDVAIGTPVSVLYRDYDDIDLTLAFFSPAARLA